MAKTFGNNPTITDPLFSGFGGTGTIPGYPLNPFDIGVGEFVAAKANDFCGCDWEEPYKPNLSIANDPHSNITFLFKNKEITQFLPDWLRQYIPVPGFKKSIKYHIFDDGNLDIGLATSNPSPEANYERTSLNNQSNWTNDNYRRGWEHIYGDTPNYRHGREISFEKGKYNRYLINNIDKGVYLKFQKNTDHIKIVGTKGKYIKSLIIVFNKEIKKATTPEGKEGLFHLFFKYAKNANNCVLSNSINSKLDKIENVIDNLVLNDNPFIGIGADSKGIIFESDGSKVQKSIIDCRFSTCDYIEWWGHLPDIISIYCVYLDPQDYFDNVLTTESFCSTFDSKGNLFVFYQDDISWTELPYIKDECVPLPSSSAAPVVEPSSSSTAGSGGFGGAAGGGGGGGGAGGGGGGGIPGGDGRGVAYSPTTSSSSSGTVVVPPYIPPTLGESSSSSSSLSDKTPPEPPESGVIRVSTSAPKGNATKSSQSVILIWENNDNTTVSYKIYRSSKRDGEYKVIGTSTTTTFIDSKPIINGWNYYKITSLDSLGNESSSLFLFIFVNEPQECKTKNCLDCEAKGFKTKNSYSVFFSSISAQALSFSCESCNNSSGYIRILEETFFKNDRSELTIGGQTDLFNPLSEGEVIPVQFCLFQDCNDKDPSKECKWTNNFYATAIIYKCKNYGCNDNIQKVLLPLTITLIQNETGFYLEMYCTSPDNKKMQIFESIPVDLGCKIPEVFLNGLKINKDRYELNSTIASLTSDPCAITPAQSIKKTTGTISCAYSPDKGLTWYNYRGLIKIEATKKAVSPSVCLDPYTNNINLFWVERDYENSDATGIAATTGFEAKLKHVVIDPNLFDLRDSFKTYYPLPEVFPELKDYDVKTVGSQKYQDAYNVSQLAQFTDSGKQLRILTVNNVLSEVYSSKNTNSLSLLKESHSCFIDSQGKLNFMRFKESGTLVDSPDKLTRRRVRKTSCGSYIWTVSGIDDTDCTCKHLVDTSYIEQDKNFFSSDKWTLKPSADGLWWEMIHDEGLKANSMAIFRKRRTSSICPPQGSYQLVCSRCSGNITGTLESRRIAIYGNNVLIDNSDLPAQQYNNTDFGPVIDGNNKLIEYTIKNNTPFPLKITDFRMVGANPEQFKFITMPRAIDPFKEEKFSIRFVPRITSYNLNAVTHSLTVVGPSLNTLDDFSNCSKNLEDKIGLRNAEVQIYTTDKNDELYKFNIKGRAMCKIKIIDEATLQAGHRYDQNVPTGTTYSADAIVTWLISNTKGLTWDKSTYDLKGGNYGSSAYDYLSKSFFNIYVTNQMLFVRRYPATSYKTSALVESDSDEKFDGFNIVKPPEVILPNTDLFALGMSYTLVQLLSLPLFFDLANINIPGEVVDSFEEDPRSKKTPLENETDPGGIAVFISGNKTGTLINAIYPYSNDYVFDETLAVANCRPVAYVTRTGFLRIFFVDENGNVNGAMLNGISSNIDSKLRQVNNG